MFISAYSHLALFAGQANAYPTINTIVIKAVRSLLSLARPSQIKSMPKSRQACQNGEQWFGLQGRY
ncbi:MULTISPECIES: hypothetical protein [unclassified Coleofasciculus]|uniref:hypothetical protein n=1 Tax=unclassified Coleofasciculus TaxID=2692782 RepID=UPI00187F7AEC|nr:MULTISPECIES: hypothetical protein [unclassified Coleofasciculus]MBE9129780.1 hypothetical protein [Coleofasciculus sp. LEGE 07081]MBE9150379.1 hypothetical protein [Coleofasciculus sp. LEGE 07092]